MARKTILTLLLCFVPTLAQAQQTHPAFLAAKESNNLQVEALKKPLDKKAVDAAQKTIVPGSPEDEAWNGALGRYLNGGTDAEHPIHLLWVSHHATRLNGPIEFSNGGKTATINTLEDIYRVSSSGRATILTDVPQEYEMHETADGWQIYRNTVHLDQGKPVEWKQVNERSWQWNRCTVAILPQDSLSLHTEELREDQTTLVESVVITANREPSFRQRVIDPRQRQTLPERELDEDISVVFGRNCADAVKRAAPGKALPDDVLKLFRGQYGITANQ